MDFFDSHCHLDFADFDSNREQTLSQCKRLGVTKIMVPGVCLGNWSKVISLCEKSLPVECYGALGLHPYFLATHQPTHLDELEKILANKSSKIKALGEIGLDYYQGKGQAKEQLSYFHAQLSLAKNLDLPVILHGRKAHDEILQCLRRFKLAKAGVVHAFSGSLQQAEQYWDLGFVLGVGGALTYSRARKLGKIVSVLGDESLVLETDAPDMAPSFARGMPNTPTNLPRIAKYIARIRQQDLEVLAANSYQNSCRVFSV